MKIALVHDQLNEFGGAERVLLALSHLYPDAPIFTAYCVKGSHAWEYFQNKDIRVSWMQYLWKLASPLRFLAPLVWNSFDFSSYDLIIGSSSWYVTKGFQKKGPLTKEICYCHTPPRWLYGYPTSIEWQRYPIIRAYAQVIGFFMRLYDYHASQRVDVFIANSKETQRRIQKVYRRDSVVVYPPIEITSHHPLPDAKKETYYLFASRPVGGKGLEIAIDAARKLGIHLKVVGAKRENEAMIEYLGHVSDEELSLLYARAKAFLALATDEDFGMTPVEAMSYGTPVIAYNGGGYIESVIDETSPKSKGKGTGILFDDPSADGLIAAIRKFESIHKDWHEDCIKQAKKFALERFEKDIRTVVEQS